MSRHAATPETYVAWRHLEVNNELCTHERDVEIVLKGNEELALLFNKLEESPTVENIENFFKYGLELQCFTQRSLARNVERYHCQNICLTDLEARPEAYTEFGTEEDIQRWVEARREDVGLAQLMTRVEEEQQLHSESVKLLAGLDALIAKRHAREQYDENHPNISETASRYNASR